MARQRKIGKELHLFENRHAVQAGFSMVQNHEIAVVIPTFDRAEMLGAAIESVLNQGSHISFELIVVDNNSNDDTRAIVESYIRKSGNIRYLFESKRGAGNARNRGIGNSSAEIIAFLDDDVRARPDWLAGIKHAFDRHPEILFVGGKVLPEWKQAPPAWLTAEHWSPLALVDYGDEAFVVDRQRQVCLVSANLAVRRNAFDRFGCFSSELMRCEDHEFELRLIQAGEKGLYVPELEVTADVQIERLSKKHHRSWHIDNGRTLAQIRAYHLPTAGIDSAEKQKDAATLFDVPSYVYRQCLGSLIPWARATAKRDESKAFLYELQARNYFSYILEIRRRSVKRRWSSVLLEAINFVTTLARRKLKKYTS